MVAASNRHYPLIDHLVKRGAPVDSELLKDRCLAKDFLFFKCLISFNINFDFALTLGFASSAGALDIVKYFVEEFHVDINGQDSMGVTALHHACEKGSILLRKIN